MTKRFADTVHGTVQLNDLELEVVETQAFQRLRGVKQLGLANLVFPGADYNRFSHSIGACHVAQRLILALSATVNMSPPDQDMYRLAALLHDVGHYPFSHAMERAVTDHYQAAGMFEDAEQPGTASPETPLVGKIDHERLGTMLIQENGCEIAEVLKNHDVDPRRITSIIGHQEDAPQFANMVSSDLDVDRIDYLLRTARHTGLPYGDIDLDYLMTMIRVDDERRICLDNRGMRTAEHLLLARYFDYQQVSHHKTVQGYEDLLRKVIESLISDNYLDCSPQWLRQEITKPEWVEFDDAFVLGLIREYATAKAGTEEGFRATALLTRNGPKEAFSTEFFSPRQENAASLADKKALLNEIARTEAVALGIPESRYWPWDNGGKVITSIGSAVPASRSRAVDQDDKQALEAAVHILEPGNTTATPLMLCKHSMISVLSNYSLAVLRLYVLLPEEEMHLLEPFRERIKARMPG